MTEPTKALTAEELGELNQYFGEHGELPHGVEEALLEMATNCLELRAHLSESRGELRAPERQGGNQEVNVIEYSYMLSGGEWGPSQERSVTTEQPCDWSTGRRYHGGYYRYRVVRYTPSQPALSADAPRQAGRDPKTVALGFLGDLPGYSPTHFQFEAACEILRQLLQQARDPSLPAPPGGGK